MTTDTHAVDNGVDLDTVLAARTAFAARPHDGVFEWRARSEWISGTHSRITVDDFVAVSAEQCHVRAFVHDADHPQLFAADDNGITPAEFVLVALAGCLTAGIATVAQHRGIQLRSVRATVTGRQDMAGTLGIDRLVRNGFSAVEVAFDIEADASTEEIEALVARSRQRSAVFDALTNPTPVAVTIAH